MRRLRKGDGIDLAGSDVVPSKNLFLLLLVSACSRLQLYVLLYLKEWLGSFGMNVLLAVFCE